jgi:dipeptidyl aminopeptidase/acylaminoacyl peptidase
MGPPVYDHPEVDLDGVWTSKKDGHLIAVHYTTDRPRWHFVDESWEGEQAAIDRALPDTWNDVVEMDAAEHLALVCASSDVVPPRYLLYDRTRRTIHDLAQAYPELRPEWMSPMQPIAFPARDGLVISGLLTRPRNAPAGPLPLIVLPHSGPTSQDVRDWNPEVQFLTSRGFAVLQLNFRGSTGFGTRYQRLGYKQWGLAMQDDLTDGVRWAVAEGIADPARIGIYGTGYGGYAALMGLVKTPELFRAGASFAGVSDIIAWLDNVDGYAFSDFNAPVHGDTSKDREQLAATSPARQADRIRAPVLIAHGTEDPIVHVDQAHRMIDALEEAGGKLEFHLYEGEVHGFIDERNAIDFYTKLAAFFERHLLGP